MATQSSTPGIGYRSLRYKTSGLIDFGRARQAKLEALVLFGTIAVLLVLPWAVAAQTVGDTFRKVKPACADLSGWQRHDGCARRAGHV